MTLSFAQTHNARLGHAMPQAHVAQNDGMEVSPKDAREKPRDAGRLRSRGDSGWSVFGDDLIDGCVHERDRGVVPQCYEPGAR